MYILFVLYLPANFKFSNMIKRLFLFISVIGIFLPCLAEKVKVNMKTQQRHSNKSPILREPAVLPVEVFFDEAAQMIEVSCLSPLEGEVFVYDASEILEDYAPCLNSILSVTDSDYHTIVIEGDDWIATGVIE